MSGTELRYITQAFEQNWVAPAGPNIEAFEASISDYIGVKHTAAVSSGTAAIHLALLVLGVKQGDYVITSTFTFAATVNPVVYLGATPVLIDSEKESWNMDPFLLEKAIIDLIRKGKKPKAIIPVHLYGMPANMERIISIANHYEIPVIEDAAEALGSKYNNKYAGTFGTMGILSFNGNKIITTSGGGALVSDNEELIEKASFLATQARDQASHYQHSHIGYNYRMSNILAGIGRGQMEVIDQRVNQRRDNHEFYYDNLKDFPGIKFLREPDSNYFSNYWLTTILIDASQTLITRDQLIYELEKENIETRPLWKPMHLQPVFSSCPAYLNGTSETLFNKGLCLPSGSNMSEIDKCRIINFLSKKLRK
jgi:dTDP-4-amino-4,6-dideoxygalactose transaminase